MGLSQWPKKFTDPDPTGKEPRGQKVTAVFEAGQVFVKVRTSSAIGLAEDDAVDSEVFAWIPISQIAGVPPRRGEWTEELVIPRWLADETGLDYEE